LPASFKVGHHFGDEFSEHCVAHLTAAHSPAYPLHGFDAMKRQSQYSRRRKD
jgi:hypothetical protein